MTYAWSGPAADFTSSSGNAIISVLVDHHENTFRQRASSEQLRAWRREVDVLQSSLSRVPACRDWCVVLEYELPFEGGRRPDSVILAGDHVLPLEFKEARFPDAAAIDQVGAYARDLAEYHSACRNHSVWPVLVLPERQIKSQDHDVHIVGPDALTELLQNVPPAKSQLGCGELLAGTYAPLPSLVEAARSIFRNEPLPYIRRAESARIPDLLRWLDNLVRDARRTQRRHLVLITGVPGSGKTLVGLQFVHEIGGAGEAEGVFLSGNDPLVDVLRDALQSKVFVRRVRDYVREYGIKSPSSVPAQHVVVFDEAQRAWDLQQMVSKHSEPSSEPAIFMRIAARVPDWSVVVGLVGQGQEIYLGEEGGLGQWKDAVAPFGNSFTVHAPGYLKSTFAGLQFLDNDLLNLTLSIRTHRAEDTDKWVAALLSGQITNAAPIASRLQEAEFDIYVTKDLERARAYAFARYAETSTKRYGLLASSKARNLTQLGIDNEYYATQRLKIGRWFNSDPSDPASCCQLRQPATEFQCQGLELDLPIVCWGDDLGWEGAWKSYRRTLKAHDSHQLRLNSYRVLLTRGRDGVVIFVPNTLREGQQHQVFHLLRSAGAVEL